MDDLEMLSEKMTVAGSIVYLTDDADSPDGMKKAGDEKEPMLKEEDRRKSDPGILPSPMACASFFSKYITMWWLNSLLKKGSKQPLEAKDLYAILEGEQTETVTDALEREWEKEMYKANQQGKYPSFLSALRRTFGVGYSLLGLLALMRKILKIAGPIFLGQLVRYFVEDSPISTGDAYLYATGLILCSLMSSMFNAPFTFMSQVYGMRIRVACTGLVYRKSLKLSTAALHGTTTGNIVNLISSDTQKFDWTAPNLHYLMIGPVIAVIVLVVLWLQIGPSALAGMGLILLLAAMQLKMGNTLFSFRAKAIHWMDERVKVMNEIIAGMRVIKMYTWEDSFSNWIRQIRKSELKWFLKLSFIQGAFQSFFFSSSVVISFVTFMTYVLTGEVLKAQTVFTCISLFNIMQVVMALQFPIAITLLNECRVSVKRMEVSNDNFISNSFYFK